MLPSCLPSKRLTHASLQPSTDWSTQGHIRRVDHTIHRHHTEMQRCLRVFEKRPRCEIQRATVTNAASRRFRFAVQVRRGPPSGVHCSPPFLVEDLNTLTSADSRSLEGGPESLRAARPLPLPTAMLLLLHHRTCRLTFASASISATIQFPGKSL